MDVNDHLDAIKPEKTLTSRDSQESSYYTDSSSFEVSDQFFDQFNDWFADNPSFMTPPGYHQVPDYGENEVVNSFGSSSYRESPINRDNMSIKLEKKDIKERVAFRTMSQAEILDDGFKWRKYGKKMVKNSPNPRNYYKCSAEGCPVKKRVEREKEDPRYVITTYEGIHSHPGPTQVNNL